MTLGLLMRHRKLPLAFILATVGADGSVVDVHGWFEELRACEYAATIVAESENVAAVCLRRAPEVPLTPVAREQPDLTE